jgi:ubiquinone/menaquinone biosynthesis C-methylase UbiE
MTLLERSAIMTTRLKYGNWVRLRALWALGLSALTMGILSLSPLNLWIRIIAASLFIVLFVSFLYPLYAYYMASPRGGNLQDRVYDLVVKSLGREVEGNVLDIGSGNGILAIRLAQAYPATQVTGIDYWGKNWEYSKSVCEENARLAGVEKQVRFQKGDAANLALADASFDAVVSNLTFHEVKTVPQKRDLAQEALRVLRPGGRFAFVDMFYDSKYYGNTSEFEGFLKGLGLSQVAVKPLGQVIALSKPLMHPKTLGRAGIVWGRK